MKLNRKQAFELSIKKWEAIARGDKIPQDILDMHIKSNCGLCEKYCNTTHISHVDNCGECPINIIPFKGNGGDFGCNRNGHSHRKYWEDPTTEKAQKVLDLIKSKM